MLGPLNWKMAIAPRRPMPCRCPGLRSARFGAGPRGAALEFRGSQARFTPQYLAETYPALVREDWTRRAIRANRPTPTRRPPKKAVDVCCASY